MVKILENPGKLRKALRQLEVKALEKGFEYKGKVYRSLSAIAKDVTGNIWNGFLFFGCME